MSKLTKKHDPLARKFLSDITVAKEFLMTHLAPEILAKVNLDSLQIESGSYVEEDLAEHYSDLVYRLELKEGKGSIYIYTLIEHQSRAEKFMPVRILRYQLAIIQNHMDKHKGEKKLPMVVSLVFYNGKASPYPYSLDIANLFSDIKAYKQAPLGTFKLVDLTITEDNELLQHGKLALLEILLKHIKKRDFNNTVELIIKALEVGLSSEISDALLNSAYSYLIKAKGKEQIDQLLYQLDKDLPDLKENIMTYAQELKQEGKQEAKLEVAKSLLLQGVDISIVEKASGLSRDNLVKLIDEKQVSL